MARCILGLVYRDTCKKSSASFLFLIDCESTIDSYFGLAKILTPAGRITAVCAADAAVIQDLAKLISSPCGQRYALSALLTQLSNGHV